MSQELKPCPFCNGTAVSHVGCGGFFIQCNDCKARSGVTKGAAGAVYYWNRRPRPEPKTALAAACVIAGSEIAAKGCHSQRDGDCTWGPCPQVRDGEPAATGRHCPLDDPEDELP